MLAAAAARSASVDSAAVAAAGVPAHLAVVVPAPVRHEAELPVLDLVARAMNDACAGKPIEIQGHVDASGEAGRDQQLSQARADEVKRLLVQRHVAAERLRAVGYGSTRPLGREPDLRALNTRITFVVAGD